MNIIIYGAGAIGSLFGAILSKDHNVFFVGRKPQVQAVKKNGLTITGKTKIHSTFSFHESIEEIAHDADIIILTVKSYDTKNAAKNIASVISKQTSLLSFQNGLNNIDDLCFFIPKKQLIAGLTSYGAMYKKPGFIEHTGIGDTIIGELDGKKTKRIKDIASMFNEVGIYTDISASIHKDMWKKAIVNSSINPLTALFQLENGYLLKNPILQELTHMICNESTAIANAMGFKLYNNEMIDLTEKVITNTKHNRSSMFQSIQQHKKTEIASINGYLATSGKKKHCNTFLNEILIQVIQSISCL